MADDTRAGMYRDSAPPRRLGGGRGAAVWEIATPGGLWAVKVAAHERTDREARALDAVSGAGVAPRLVASGDGVVVTERIAGDVRPATHWSAADARAVGALLRRLHESVAPNLSSADAVPGAWADRTAEVVARVDDADRPLAARAIAALPAPAGGRAVLLHGDPWSGNVVWGARGPLLVDWEFARDGEPAEDLAYLAAMDALPPPALDDLLAGYGADATTAARATAWRPFMALWIAGWYAALGDAARSARLRAHAAQLVAEMSGAGPGGA